MKKLFILLLLCFGVIGIKAQDCTLSVRTDNPTMGKVRVKWFENGHEYVDLGLPSGLLWATCNVGANAPEEYGNRYFWGETETRSDYSIINYKYHISVSFSGYLLTKYCLNSKRGYNGFTDNKTVLDLTDDAARVNWGGNWRMPTSNEMGELKNNCTWTWTTRNGLEGYNVKGPNGNSIFLPAENDSYGTVWSTVDGNTYCLGGYWSSSLYLADTSYNYAFVCWIYCNGTSSELSISAAERYGERAVRPVLAQVSDTTDTTEQDPETPTPIPDPNNGYDYVDLGLSVYWATCNVGASTPEEYGNYYAWGEIETKSDYSWATYKYANGDDHKLTKYCYDSSFGNNGFTDTKTVLDLTDDAARTNWGGKWRIPTEEEIRELSDECVWTWTTRNGVNGYNVEGPNGNSIFLPAAGSGGYYWSSTLKKDFKPNNAYNLHFGSVNHLCDGRSRYYGHSVRPVCDR